MKIVIPGGSGQMGQLLARRFHAGGHEVIILSREHTPAPWQVLAWDGRTAGPWIDALDGSDVCINLAGRSVNCRYTPDNRTEIYKSRIESTLLFNKVIGSLQQPPSVWLNASTAKIYRHSLDQPMDESTGELGGDEPGAPEKWNFSVQVAKDREAAFFSQPIPRTRKIATRSAITFNADPGSVFEVLSRLVRAGLGGTNGSGDQFVSWIHETDFVRAIEWLIATKDIAGVVNIASPKPLPNRDFMRALRRAWAMPFGLPAPGWMIQAGSFLLQTESELVLKSRRVVPDHLLASGFGFEFSTWSVAAKDLVRRWKTSRS